MFPRPITENRFTTAGSHHLRKVTKTRPHEAHLIDLTLLPTFDAPDTGTYKEARSLRLQQVGPRERSVSSSELLPLLVRRCVTML